MIVEILIFLATAFLVLYTYFRYKYSYWKNKGLTYLEPSFPYGNTKEIVNSYTDLGTFYRRLYDENRDKPLLGGYMFHTPFLMVNDPSLLVGMLKKDFSYFEDRGIYVETKNDPISGNLFMLSSDMWRNLRRKLSPAFSKNKINICFPNILTCCERLTKVMGKISDNGKPIDIKDMSRNFTLDVISSCAFGMESNSLEHPANMVKKTAELFFSFPFGNNVKFFLSFFAPEVAKYWPFKFVPQLVEDFFLGAAKDIVHAREENNQIRNDLMQLMIEIRKNGSIEEDEVDENLKYLQNGNIKSGTGDLALSVTEIAAQMFVFQMAGFETSSSTLAYLLYEVGQNAEIQRKMHEEIDEKLNKHGQKISYELIHDLPYTTMVLDETLRKYPIVPVLNRVSVKNYVFPGTDVVIEPGLKIIVPLMGLHYDEKYFEDPHKFDPERFSPENKKNIPQCVYMPFGDGPRYCIGMKFAFLQMKSALVTMISEFEFETLTKEKLTFDPRIFPLTAQQNISLRLTKRRK